MRYSMHGTLFPQMPVRAFIALKQHAFCRPRNVMNSFKGNKHMHARRIILHEGSNHMQIHLYYLSVAAQCSIRSRTNYAKWKKCLRLPCTHRACTHRACTYWACTHRACTHHEHTGRAHTGRAHTGRAHTWRAHTG